MDKKKRKEARKLFDLLRDAFDGRGFKYGKQEKDDELGIFFSVQKGELWVDYRFVIDAERMLIRLYSVLPAQFAGGMDGALAVCLINQTLTDGCVDYAPEEGSCLFRLNVSFADSKISEDVFDDMYQCAMTVAETFSLPLRKLSGGEISYEEFRNQILPNA